MLNFDNKPEQSEGELNYLTVNMTTFAGRIAARAYAYALLAQGHEYAAQRLFDIVGRSDKPSQSYILDEEMGLD